VTFYHARIAGCPSQMQLFSERTLPSHWLRSLPKGAADLPLSPVAPRRLALGLRCTFPKDLHRYAQRLCQPIDRHKPRHPVIVFLITDVVDRQSSLRSKLLLGQSRLLA
jgi:hypothetical protein